MVGAGAEYLGNDGSSQLSQDSVYFAKSKQIFLFIFVSSFIFRPVLNGTGRFTEAVVYKSTGVKG